MPELPEVETVRRGLAPHIVGRTIERVVVRDRRLRWPIARGFERKLAGREIHGIDRRGKYLLVDLGGDRVILHLGMTGRLSLLTPGKPVQKHDHLDLELSGQLVLRFNDPRRFGAALWWPASQPAHALLKHMGPEPFADAFDADYLFKLSRGRSAPLKNFLMDGRIVVGVGNIYAVESLFRAGIKPMRKAGRVTREEYGKLVKAVREVLNDAIAAGGTTFRDFLDTDGEPGYFVQKLFVYDRAGQPCRRCKTPIKRLMIGQRSSYYCPRCQS
ncbi:MAG: bifunctional DNA-formamidopyrimidine glycosylase/DNA-(apurinic or apyrimidinic site) lyase [Gammaproteobacteria bacterium]